MLNKEICKKCAEELGYDWDYNHEEFWEKKGKTCCPHGQSYFFTPFKRFHVLVVAPPPSGCPYKMEHIVMRRKPC